MSYICLISNDKNAVVCSDSRETYPFDIHIDNCIKTFSSSGSMTVWTCCGLKMLGTINLFNQVNSILSNDEKTIEQRISVIVPLLRYATRIYSTVHKKKGIFNLLIAHKSEGKIRVFSVDAVSGQATVRKKNLPCFIQAGSNICAMSRADTSSLDGLSLEELTVLAENRVNEAENKCVQRFTKDASYNCVTGGKVQLESLTLR